MREHRIPLFFRIWVILVIVLAAAVVGGQLWLAVTILTNPELVGQWFGEVLAGVSEGAAR